MPFNLKKFILRGHFLPYLFFSAIGVAVLSVTGSIIISAVENHGLIPPPSTLKQYECTGSKTPFSFYYLHGTERVKIKSSVGTLEGTVRQNQFDWAAFADDASMLGFLPPTKIAFEDATSVRIALPGAVEVTCGVRATPPAPH